MPQKEDVLVVFGSATDAGCYSKIIARFEGLKVKSRLAVLSAHKTPKDLNKALKKTPARIFVAGAGVAAALPGVVAAETIRPVIGVPCYGAYNGLDAFLSIHQMPPGIPVIGVGVEATGDCAELAMAYLSGLDKIVLLEPSTDSAKKMLVKSENQLNEMVFSDEAVVLNVPVKEASNEDDAIVVFKMARKGFWLGLNRAENAAIAAVQLINLNGKYNKCLNAYRKKIAEKVLGSNREINS